MIRLGRLPPLVTSAALVLSPAVLAQEEPDLAALALRFAAMTAATGFEERMADTVLTLVPASHRDRAGNVLRRADAAPRRLVACPLDEPAWVVGAVRPDGWLTLRRTPGPPDPSRDRQLQGARVTVFGRRGPVPGVVAVRSIHLTRAREDAGTAHFTADSALVDLGAESADAVARLGVRVLSPVALAKRPHRYGNGLLAAPHAGRRAACAALVRAAAALTTEGVTVAFTVQHELGGRGLAAAARLHGPFTETLLLESGESPPGRPVREESGSMSGTELGRVTRLSLPVRYRGTPAETVALEDVRVLVEEVVAWGGRGR